MRPHPVVIGSELIYYEQARTRTYCLLPLPLANLLLATYDLRRALYLPELRPPLLLPPLLLPPLLVPPLLLFPYCEQMAPVLAEAVIELTAAGGVAYLVSCATHAPWRHTCTLARHMHSSLLASSVAAAG